MLSLDDCIKSAFQNNLDIRSTDNLLHSTQVARDEIDRTGLPQARLNGKAMIAPYSNHFGYDPAITDGGQFSAQIDIQTPLYDGGARSLKTDKLTIEVNRLHTERQRTERDLRYSVTLSFIDVMEAEKNLKLQQQRMEDLSDYHALVNRLFHGGSVNYGDVLKIEVTLENGKLSVQKAFQTYTEAKITLAETMGTPSDTTFNISGTFEIPDSVEVDSLLHNNTIDSAHLLDLQIADFSIQQNLLDIELARSERLPSISLGGDVGLLTSADNIRLPSDQRVSMIGYSLGISIENLLFNWGMTDLRVQQRQLDAEHAQLNYQQQRRTLTADVERLHNQIIGAMSQLGTIDHAVKISQDNYTYTKALYARSGTSALEVLAAEQLLADNRLTSLQTNANLRRLLAKAEQLFTH